MKLNLSLWFKPTSFNLVLVALAQITTYLHVMIMHHNVHCIDCILSVFAGDCSPSVDVCFDDVINDTDEELYHLQKC